MEIDPADIRELVHAMIADVPGLLGGIEAAVAAGDRAAAKTASHTLRGMLLNFGCAAAAKRLLDFEKNGWAGGGEEDPALAIAGFKACWQATRAELEHWLSGLRPDRS